MCSHIFLNVGLEMDSLLDPVIDSSHMSFFVVVEHRALEVLRPCPPREAISIHHDWVDRYVMKYYCLSLMYSSVFLCFDNFVYSRLRESGLLTLGRLVEGGLVQLDRSLLMVLVDRWRPETHVPPPVWGDDSYAAGCGQPPRPPYRRGGCRSACGGGLVEGWPGGPFCPG